LSKTLGRIIKSVYWWFFIRIALRVRFFCPKNIILNGRLILDNNSQLSLDKSSQIIVEGIVHIRRSNLYLRNTSLRLNSSEIVNSCMTLVNSDVSIGDLFLLSDGEIKSNKTVVRIGNNFRLLGSSILLQDNSQFTAGNFLLIQKQSNSVSSIVATRANILIGSNVRLMCKLSCDNSKFYIGDNVFINDGTEIRCYDHITIGKNVFISYDCIIFDTNTHSTDPLKRLQEIHHGFPNATVQTPDLRPVTKPIYIGNNVWMGMRSAILKGSQVSDDAIIGLYAVVTGQVPKGYLAIGNPFVVKRPAKNKPSKVNIDREL